MLLRSVPTCLYMHSVESHYHLKFEWFSLRCPLMDIDTCHAAHTSIPVMSVLDCQIRFFDLWKPELFGPHRSNWNDGSMLTFSSEYCALPQS